MKPMTLRASCLTALLCAGGVVAQSGEELRASLTTQPAPEAGQVMIRLTLHNLSSTGLTLTLPYAGKQSCATAPHVRVLRASTREVVYPVGNEATFVTCLAGSAKFQLAKGGVLTFDRSIQLNAGRYVVEAYVPATPETARTVSAGYITINMP